MNKIWVDCSQFVSEKAMHTVLKERLKLPAYYGANLDALNDCLKGWHSDDFIILFNVSRAFLTLGEQLIMPLIAVFVRAMSENNTNMIFCMGSLSDCECLYNPHGNTNNLKKDVEDCKTLKCRALLSRLYSLSCAGGLKPNKIFEKIAQCKPNVDALTVDDYRNWPDTFGKFNSRECAFMLDDIYVETCRLMSTLEYDECDEIFECIELVLGMAANASSHGLTVTDRLEDDWRDFDRLDVPEERQRFYKKYSHR